MNKVCLTGQLLNIKGNIGTIKTKNKNYEPDFVHIYINDYFKDVIKNLKSYNVAIIGHISYIKDVGEHLLIPDTLEELWLMRLDVNLLSI